MECRVPSARTVLGVLRLGNRRLVDLLEPMDADPDIVQQGRLSDDQGKGRFGSAGFTSSDMHPPLGGE